ncbi:MAG: hypothetical protein OCD01_03725 [Fibrobacterales bacterium]
MKQKLKEVIAAHAVELENGIASVPIDSFELIIDEILSQAGDYILDSLE